MAITKEDYEKALMSMKIEHLQEMNNQKRQMDLFKENAFNVLKQHSFLALNDVFYQNAQANLLLNDVTRESDCLREKLSKLKSRIMPELKNRPDKEERVVGYYKWNGSLNVYISRCQKVLADQLEVYRRRNTGRGKFSWIEGTSKFLDVKCSNGVQLWNKVRENSLFRGVIFTNSCKTHMKVMTRDELMKKCKNNEDLVEEILLDPVQVCELIKGAVQTVLDELDREVSLEGEPIRRGTKVYTEEEVKEYAESGQLLENMIKSKHNINFFNLLKQNENMELTEEAHTEETTVIEEVARPSEAEPSRIEAGPSRIVPVIVEHPNSPSPDDDDIEINLSQTIVIDEDTVDYDISKEFNETF
ncbi:Baculovirus repeated ORFs [Phthorimaea operculella granulovirus]|uniref:BRO n=1 Tax=Phthorimaea operculella granulovirus TaxID=192584 RepID=Q8JS50_9BBAC|nr:Baculovirus repeated ORFs [Phthorimaea operculella granulovirus]AAM70207.1 Baculovirus repeated ORFs [Phthorimaea operculella granulovirus]ANY57398.1 Baculovirus repeated ORFs [Phthorimaea operculella granulovirus]QBH65844.1 BRO [Phthorimaea operculella granulovirus]QBH65974.1 BRO [Phthorimaea operculella granulovirus]QBH66104.1 BRO [Phthorimaea operculella granulovirus]